MRIGAVYILINIKQYSIATSAAAIQLVQLQGADAHFCLRLCVLRSHDGLIHMYPRPNDKSGLKIPHASSPAGCPAARASCAAALLAAEVPWLPCEGGKQPPSGGLLSKQRSALSKQRSALIHFCAPAVPESGIFFCQARPLAQCQGAKFTSGK